MKKKQKIEQRLSEIEWTAYRLTIDRLRYEAAGIPIPKRKILAARRRLNAALKALDALSAQLPK